MPFLLPLLPTIGEAVVGSVVGAGVNAGINELTKGNEPQAGAGAPPAMIMPQQVDFNSQQNSPPASSMPSMDIAKNASPMPSPLGSNLAKKESFDFGIDSGKPEGYAKGGSVKSKGPKVSKDGKPMMAYGGDLFGDPIEASMRATSANPEFRAGVDKLVAESPQGKAQALQAQNVLADNIAQGNSANALTQQQQLINALAAQNGIQNQSNVYNQQQALADQLAAMGRGEGPNPALAQLANTTGNNINQQSAMMASQRGSGANAGLLARQAAMQGGNIQQQAAGQAAALRSQQQLNAIGALQGQQGMMGNIANAQVGQLQQGIGTLNQNALQKQQLAQNASLAANQIAAQQGMNAANIANAQQMQGQGFTNDLIKGGLSAAGSAVMSQVVPKIGNALSPSAGSNIKYADPNQPWLGGYAKGGQVPSSNAILKENYKGSSKLGSLLHQAYANGGKVHNMVSGGHVPGKAPVAGAVDSYKNDVVDAKLSPGEIVLPRSVTQSADPVSAAAKFVAALQAKKGKR